MSRKKPLTEKELIAAFEEDFDEDVPLDMSDEDSDDSLQDPHYNPDKSTDNDEDNATGEETLLPVSVSSTMQKLRQVVAQNASAGGKPPASPVDFENIVWTDPTGRQQHFPFIGKSGQKICIDETLVPFRGRLSFRQYIPSKRHRYGIKLYKLCTDKGYTWNMSIYVGKDNTEDRTQSASQNVTMKLIEELLNEGRTLFVDNFYTSMPLAYQLLAQKTHLIGTLRANRKYISPAVKDAKLAKNQIIAKETPDGVTILKWRDQRDVRMLTTCHSGSETVVTRNKHGKEKIKPKCIVDYDHGKFLVDVSDQLASYNTALRRCSKWYRKLLIEVLWGTALVNASYLYNENSVNKENMNITLFRQSVVSSLLETSTKSASSSSRRNSRGNAVRHLVTHEAKKRARCVSCYSMYGKNGKIVDGKKKMASQDITVCDECEGNPHFCKDCFNNNH
ncbi:piggyBac transposable element-derived protein 4-like [Euwallacea similis]|uniref:piggyBac transposable element-derived protein 4-like n=1 Tax=Euwallacea similis TaxID=1736056 RepID=UPI003450AD04